MLRAVIVCVMLTGLFGMVSGVNRVAMRHVRMMPGLVMVAGFVMLGGRSVMLCGVLVMFGGFAMVISGFFGHMD
jgi:hypothetical protein